MAETIKMTDMDTSGYSIPYLASWSGSQDTRQLKACMDTIRRTAGEIIEEMDAFMAERMKERTAEQSADQDTDHFTIYQIREGSPAGVFEYMGMDYVRRKGYETRQEDYQKVYTASLSPQTSLEDLFVQFNGPKMPKDFTGHSLSVSDIVVIHRAGEDHAFFVDRFGYEEVPEFLTQVQAQEKSVPTEGKLLFFVAQCMDFPVMGEYHGELSLIEALKIYSQMPDGQMGITEAKERMSVKKESVLKTLNENREKVKASDKAQAGRVQRDRGQAVRKKKGEQAL